MLMSVQCTQMRLWQQNTEDGDVKESASWYWSRIECYNFRVLQVTLEVNTKKLTTEYAKGKWEGNQNVSLQKKQVKERKVETQEMNEKKKAVRHIENNNMEKVSPSLSVICKWSKLPNQKK